MQTTLRSAAAGLAMGLALCACAGAGEPPADPNDLARTAADQVTDASYRIAFSMTVNGIPEVGSLSASAVGVVDSGAGTSELEWDMADALRAIGGAFGTDMPPGLLEPITVRGVDGMVYLHLPKLSETAGIDTSWLSFDYVTPGIDGIFGGDSALMSEPSAMADPAPFLSVLALLAAAELEELDAGEVNGVAVRHVRARLSLEDVLVATGVDPAELEGMPPGPTVLVDAWIDDEGRLVRLEERFPIDDPEAEPADPADTVVAIDLSDYGTAVDVEAPDPGDVTDGAEVMGP